MTPKYKSPSKKPPFDTTTIGSRFIAPALPWIALLLAAFALLYLNSNSPITLHHSNPHKNQPSCPSKPQDPIATPPNQKIPAYTPSDPQSCDSTNLLTLAYPITNSISAFIYTTTNPCFQPVAYIRLKPYALLITTNLTRRPCPCGFCDPSRSVAVPEHINSIGHDLTYSVTTQFLPVIYLQETKSF